MKLSTLVSVGLAVVGAVAHPSHPAHSHHNRRQTNTTAAATIVAATVKSTILVLAVDAAAAASASSGLNAYGIPYQVLLVPQSGVTLPVLNTTAGGNFGGIIIASGVPYDYGAEGWHSALTDAQWNTLYAYQLGYGVRMVQYDVYPQPQFGTTPTGSCCGAGVEHLISFSNTTAFTQAGIKPWAGLTTQGLFHYVASITDPATTIEIAQFAPNSQFPTNTTAGVINNFGGREQMVFFISWATEWSPTSNFLQHAYITWMTRGLYAGYRRVNLNTQIDDMFLETEIYYPSNGQSYRVTPADLTPVRSWVPTIQAKMNPGSYYRPEVGHNGDGNIIYADNTAQGETACVGEPIYTSDIPETPLEFQKPLGSGVNAWPATPTTYPYSLSCTGYDPLKVWWATSSNRNQFMHLSHTFTHQNENNATYSDIYKEITFNQAWLRQVGLTSGNFSADALIPPAITGLHNGDAIRAWVTAGLTNSVGDNSRAPLRNSQNPMWPYTTTLAANGYDGFKVIPRWPTRIYYNCDTPACTLQEWINTSAGSGDFNNLLAQDKADTMRHLFGLYHDGYMFHQLNLRTTGMAGITTPYGTTVNSLFQAWTEVIVFEFTRLVNWPMTTLKQSDLAVSFNNRMARDACGYNIAWTISNQKITGVTVTANSNTCSAAIPLTVPGPVTNTQGFATEKVGNDPLTIWVRLTGTAVSFTLTTPISI